MDTATTDSRVRRGNDARTALRAALLDLKSDPKELSAAELCRLAGVDQGALTGTVVGVPAFAAETVEALVRDAAEEWITESDGSDSMQPLAERIVTGYWRLVERHRELHRWVLGEQGSASAQNGALHIITWAVLHDFHLARPNGDAATLAAQARMIAGGLYAQLVAWLSEPDPAPADEVGEWVLRQLNRLGDALAPDDLIPV